MSANYKTSYKVYSAWNYQKELEDLNRASEQGWQLVKGGCLHSKFVHNPQVQYRYQLDYQNVEDMARYIETFREQGWEYVNSTFNGWHYFRKLWDPSLPEQEYEIFTDKESLHEMNNRWARVALILGVLTGVSALICLIRMILAPHIPVLALILTFAIESAIMLRGWSIMHSPNASRNRRGDRVYLAAVFLALIVGCTASIVLMNLRPDLSWQQTTPVLAEPKTDQRLVDFTVTYPDHYYLDLDLKSEGDVTFEIVNVDGKAVYSETGSDIHKDDARIRLARGQYSFALTAEHPFDLTCSIG